MREALARMAWRRLVSPSCAAAPRAPPIGQPDTAQHTAAHFARYFYRPPACDVRPRQSLRADPATSRLVSTPAPVSRLVSFPHPRVPRPPGSAIAGLRRRWGLGLVLVLVRSGPVRAERDEMQFVDRDGHRRNTSSCTPLRKQSAQATTRQIRSAPAAPRDVLAFAHPSEARITLE